METTYKVLKILIWILALAVLLTGASLLYNHLGSQVEVAVVTEEIDSTSGTEGTNPLANPAPDFTVYDGEGNSHKLSDFQGKPVILNFWASWCGICVEEMPEFQRFYEAYGEQVQLLMVNLTDGRQETLETASAFLTDAGYSFSVYFDMNMEAAYQYSVQAIPVTFFIDAQGNLKTYIRGSVSEAVLRKVIDPLIG